MNSDAQQDCPSKKKKTKTKQNKNKKKLSLVGGSLYFIFSNKNLWTLFVLHKS